MTSTVAADIRRLAEERILVLDGAWGVLLQNRGLAESDFRGERFASHSRDLLNNPDVLNLVRPDVVRAVHAAGGVTSIAHPVWYKDQESLIRALAGEGLDGIEVRHPDHGPAEEARFGRLADELGLLRTAGSDFHGTPEGRKAPGGVTGDRPMLEALQRRARR